MIIIALSTQKMAFASAIAGKYTLSDRATPYKKGYRRDIWSPGTNSTVLFSATPYSGGPQTVERKMSLWQPCF